MIVPPLVFTEEQSSELADLKTTILNYVKESLARAVTGEIDIDTQWSGYLRELDNMGLDRFLEINQEAYDAKYGG
jgi:putative aldouronate transport system substrate-binding protein